MSPEMGYSQDNKVASIFDMDMLRLKKMEKARIALMDKTVKVQLCHWVRDPSAGEGDRKGRYVVCLGDYATVMRDGADPTRCPACRIAEPGQDSLVSVARRRFVTHIARYRTNAKGQVLAPISLALQGWIFSDDKYNMLADRTAEHGDLRKHDITLTCTAEQYQKFDMDVSPKLLFAGDEAAKTQYMELQKARSQELERLLGAPMKYEALETFLGKATPVIGEEEVAQTAEEAVAEVTAELETEVVGEAVEPLTAEAGAEEVPTEAVEEKPAVKPAAKPVSKPAVAAKPVTKPAAQAVKPAAKPAAKEAPIDLDKLLDS